MSTRTLTKIAAAALMGATFLVAPISTASAGHRHHGCGGCSAHITRYVDAGVVSYPIYRIDHYKVDYSKGAYTYTNACCGWGW